LSAAPPPDQSCHSSPFPPSKTLSS
jgi:hypothetical protein